MYDISSVTLKSPQMCSINTMQRRETWQLCLSQRTEWMKHRNSLTDRQQSDLFSSVNKFIPCNEALCTDWSLCLKNTNKKSTLCFIKCRQTTERDQINGEKQTRGSAQHLQRCVRLFVFTFFKMPSTKAANRRTAEPLQSLPILNYNCVSSMDGINVEKVINMCCSFKDVWHL